MSSNNNFIFNALSRQPNNINFLSPHGHRFVLFATPSTNYFITGFRTPQIQAGTANIATPFKTINFPGTSINYSSFELTFKVDEDMSNYLELFNWLRGETITEEFQSYIDVNKKISQGKIPVSDASFIIMSNEMKPNIEMKFTDVYPTFLSNLDFYSNSNDLTYISASVQFEFTLMNINKF